MLKYRHIINKSARRISDAGNRTVDDLASARLEHEPEFTAKMLGRMEEAMNGYRVGRVKWEAKILTSQGANAQEKIYGADFFGVLDLDLSDYKIRKGFLAQAKRVESNGIGINASEWQRMKEQCVKMLSVTAESFVFVYSPQSIQIIPATAIIAAQHPANFGDFYSRSLYRFYQEHFECFIGDILLRTPDIATLKHVETLKNGILLRASQDSQFD